MIIFCGCDNFEEISLIQICFKFEEKKLDEVFCVTNDFEDTKKESRRKISEKQASSFSLACNFFETKKNTENHRVNVHFLTPLIQINRFVFRVFIRVFLGTEVGPNGEPKFVTNLFQNDYMWGLSQF